MIAGQCERRVGRRGDLHHRGLRPLLVDRERGPHNVVEAVLGHGLQLLLLVVAHAVHHPVAQEQGVLRSRTRGHRDLCHPGDSDGRGLGRQAQTDVLAVPLIGHDAGVRQPEHKLVVAGNLRDRCLHAAGKGHGHVATALVGGAPLSQACGDGGYVRWHGRPLGGCGCFVDDRTPARRVTGHTQTAQHRWMSAGAWGTSSGLEHADMGGIQSHQDAWPCADGGGGRDARVGLALDFAAGAAALALNFAVVRAVALLGVRKGQGRVVACGLQHQGRRLEIRREAEELARRHGRVPQQHH